MRYRGPDGRMRSAPETFARKVEAQRYLTLVESQIARGEWTDPERAKVTLGDYAERWIAERPGLRPRTVELYRWLLRRHVVPWLGGVPLGKIDTPLVREWRAKLLAEGVSVSTTAKAYRFLRSVLMTAANEDRIIPRNPCQVRGADKEQPNERSVLTVAEVTTLADAMPARFRAMILLTTFASLRFGEVTALERRDVDLVAGTVRVRRTFVEVRGEGLVPGPPKSQAGRRTVSVPPTVVEVMRETWRRTSATIPRRWCSPVRRAGRSGGGTSGRSRRGRRPLLAWGWLGCTSMTFGTPGTRSPRAAV